MSHPHVDDARKILISLGLPRAQQNERSALSLLALLDLRPKRKWAEAQNPLIGITPIMDWIRDHYKRTYAPNTRETVRRQTMHQFVDAGLALYNPDKPDRPVNSPAAVYQIEPSALALLRSFHTKAWHTKLTAYLAKRQTLAARYAHARKQKLIPLQIAPGKEITLSPGEHSELIRAIVEDFGARFVPGGVLIYAGDTGEKWGYFDAMLLSKTRRQRRCPRQDAGSGSVPPGAQLAVADRIRDQPWPRGRQTPCRACSTIRQSDGGPWSTSPRSPTAPS
jgi:hypothetical protein